MTKIYHFHGTLSPNTELLTMNFDKLINKAFTQKGSSFESTILAKKLASAFSKEQYKPFFRIIQNKDRTKEDMFTAIIQTLSNPTHTSFTDSPEPKVNQSTKPPTSTIFININAHQDGRREKNLMNPAIRKAIAVAEQPLDVGTVWSALLVDASSIKPTAPISGIENKKILLLDGTFFTKEKLRKSKIFLDAMQALENAN